VHTGKCYASAEVSALRRILKKSLQQNREPTSPLLAGGKDVR